MKAPTMRDHLRSPVAVYALLLTQVVAVLGYVNFLFFSGPTRSDATINVEMASFLVMPFVWVALFLAGLWLLRQPLPRTSHVAIRAGLALTGLCGIVAVGFVCLFVVADLIFWLTDF